MFTTFFAFRNIFRMLHASSNNIVNALKWLFQVLLDISSCKIVYNYTVHGCSDDIINTGDMMDFVEHI